MNDATSDEPQATFSDCMDCGALYVLKRGSGGQCADCQHLEVRYPDGLPAAIEGALAVSRTLRTIFTDRELIHEKSVIGELGRIADRLEHLERIADTLDRVEERLSEIAGRDAAT